MPRLAGMQGEGLFTVVYCKLPSPCSGLSQTVQAEVEGRQKIKAHLKNLLFRVALLFLRLLTIYLYILTYGIRPAAVL